MKLDRYNIAILQTLQRHGRMSNRELADKIGISPAPCWRRVQELEKHGVISRYAALIDPAKLGYHTLAFAHVSMENHHPDTLIEFDKAIKEAPEVLECYMTSGEYDYMLKVVATDMAAYGDFLNRVLMQIPSVRTVNTSFALRQQKMFTELPLGPVTT